MISDRLNVAARNYRAGVPDALDFLVNALLDEFKDVKSRLGLLETRVNEMLRMITGE